MLNLLCEVEEDIRIVTIRPALLVSTKITDCALSASAVSVCVDNITSRLPIPSPRTPLYLPSNDKGALPLLYWTAIPPIKEANR